MTRQVRRSALLLAIAVFGSASGACPVGAQSGAPSPSARETPSTGPMITAEGLRAADTNRPTDPALEKRTSEVASALRCPVCQGLSIQDSPSELAQQMRSLVRDQLAAGKSPEEVRRYFISKYGERSEEHTSELQSH